MMSQSSLDMPETPRPPHDGATATPSEIGRAFAAATQISAGELRNVASDLSHHITTTGGHVAAQVVGHSTVLNDLLERMLQLAGRQAAWALESRKQLDTLAD